MMMREEAGMDLCRSVGLCVEDGEGCRGDGIERGSMGVCGMIKEDDYGDAW